MRNALTQASKTQRHMVSATIGTVFVQDTPEATPSQWRSVADQLREKFPKLASLMDEAENDVPAFMMFQWGHWKQIYSTDPLDRLKGEIKRRTNVVGIFPNDASITRLVGSMMLEQNDEWRLNRDCMPPEGLQSHCDTVPDLAVRCGSLSAVYLSLSGLGTYTTGLDTTVRDASASCDEAVCAVLHSWRRQIKQSKGAGPWSLRISTADALVSLSALIWLNSTPKPPRMLGTTEGGPTHENSVVSRVGVVREPVWPRYRPRKPLWSGGYGCGMGCRFQRVQCREAGRHVRPAGNALGHELTCACQHARGRP